MIFFSWVKLVLNLYIIVYICIVSSKAVKVNLSIMVGLYRGVLIDRIVIFNHLRFFKILKNFIIN